MAVTLMASSCQMMSVMFRCFLGSERPQHLPKQSRFSGDDVLLQQSSRHRLIWPKKRGTWRWRGTPNSLFFLFLVYKQMSRTNAKVKGGQCSTDLHTFAQHVLPKSHCAIAFELQYFLNRKCDNYHQHLINIHSAKWLEKGTSSFHKIRPIFLPTRFREGAKRPRGHPIAPEVAIIRLSWSHDEMRFLNKSSCFDPRFFLWTSW